MFDVIRCNKDYSGNDPSMTLHVASMQQALECGEVQRWVWLGSSSMMADATTKWMEDQLIHLWYRTGSFDPVEFDIFESISIGTRRHLSGVSCPTGWCCVNCGEADVVLYLEDDDDNKDQVWEINDLIFLFESWGFL